MEERTTLIKIRNGEQLVVPKRILIADSPVFRYLLDELNDDEHEFDDFSSQAVMLFIFLLENKQLEDIQDSMFRELHKLATIFKVKWLKDSCCSWLREKMESATTDDDKIFVFEECWFILHRWDEKGLMNSLISKFASKDNANLITKYMRDMNKVDTGQIELLL